MRVKDREDAEEVEKEEGEGEEEELSKLRTPPLGTLGRTSLLLLRGHVFYCDLEKTLQ